MTRPKNPSTPIRLSSDITADILITFITPDGFTFQLTKDGEQWTDGDMVYAADTDSWPLDDDGNRLEGRARRHDFGADRSVYLDSDGTRTVIQSYGDGESWWKHVIMPRQAVNAWIDERLEEGYAKEYLTPLSCLMENSHLAPAYDRGPGRAFADVPHIDKITPRYVVASQHGGLDI